MRASNSAIQTYKSCRRLYWFRYVEEIEPNKTPEVLERGKSYHSKLEQIMSCGSFERDSNLKTNAMARAFQEFIFPHIFATDVEEWFEFNTASGHKMVGRIDGRNGTEYLIEHKTTSAEVNDEYVNKLVMDEQILTYMLATGIRDMKYTVCRTPTIRQKQNETDEAFEERCFNWYLEDTDKKIAVIDLKGDDAEIAEFAKTLDATIDEMSKCKLFYRNTRYCDLWGRPCDYAPICARYKSDEEYIGFTRSVK